MCEQSRQAEVQKTSGCVAVMKLRGFSLLGKIPVSALFKRSTQCVSRSCCLSALCAEGNPRVAQATDILGFGILLIPGIC